MARRGGQCDRAILVSVGRFDPGAGLSPRPGVRADMKRMHRTLRRLGFSVELHMDLSSNETYQLFEEESRRSVKDCFLAVLSSHGEEGCVFGADGQPVHLSRIFSYFDNKIMENKVKLFFIQACRGAALDDGIEVDSGYEADETFSPSLSVPIDTAVMFATAPGYVAFSHPSGSVFLQTLCTILEEDGNRNLELTRLLTRLNHRIAYTFQARGREFGGKKEMPCVLSRLTRDVFPFAEPADPNKDSSVLGLTLSRPENVRKRMPSIS